MSECQCLHRPLALDPHTAGVTGNCEYSSMDAGSSSRAVLALHYCAISPSPTFEFLPHQYTKTVYWLWDSCAELREQKTSYRHNILSKSVLWV